MLDPVARYISACAQVAAGRAGVHLESRQLAVGARGVDPGGVFLLRAGPHAPGAGPHGIRAADPQR